MADAVRYVRQRRLTPVAPHLVTTVLPPSLGPIDLQAADSFYDALVRDDTVAARAIVSGRYLSGANIAAIGDSLIQPVLMRLGNLWTQDAKWILVEHRTVDTCLRALADVLEWLPPIPPGAPVSISAAGPGDRYLLPPVLASMTLREQGFESKNIGPETPIDTLVLAAERYRAVLCSVSVSTPFERKRQQDWESLAERLEAANTRLVVGGRCSSCLSADFLSRIQSRASMVELGAYAAGVLQGVAPALGGRRRSAT